MGIISDMQATLIDRRYFVIGLLGRGGMGEVYLARDEVLGRDVALKILKKEYASLEEFRKRMGREAESAASLSNPNIVRVYDRGETKDALPYIAMEYMKGGTLAEKIRRERTLAWREAVKVGDFGIAQAAAASTLTETSMILGTARYLSPEQAKGEPVGSGSDLYSLGITLYQMLSGKVPFEAESPLAIAMRHVYEVASSPKEINPDVPEELAAITLLLLSKDPLARYGEDALTLVDDLERVCRGLKPLYKRLAISPENSTEPLGVPPVTLRRERHVRRRSKKGRVVGATTVAVLALGLTLGGAYAHGFYEFPFSYSTNATDQKEIMPMAPPLGSFEAPSPPEDPQEETMDPVAMEAQPVAYTASVQEELPAAAPAIAQQETEPVVVQEVERPTPAPVVREEQNSKERPKEEAEEQAKDAEKATKEAEEVAREAQEEAVKEAKELAEQAQENAKESAKKWHNGW
jgi:hypothetical protein